MMGGSSEDVKRKFIGVRCQVVGVRKDKSETQSSRSLAQSFAKASVEAGAQLFAGDAFAAVSLGDALFESGDDAGAAGGEVLLLSFEEIEGVGEELRRLGVRAAGELALEALFGGGIWRDDHEEIIGLRFGEGKDSDYQPCPFDSWR